MTPLCSRAASEHSATEEDGNESPSVHWTESDDEPGDKADQHDSAPDPDKEADERTWESAKVLCLMVDACRPGALKCFDIISEAKVPHLNIAVEDREMFENFIEFLLVGERQDEDSTSAAEHDVQLREADMVPALRLKDPASLFEVVAGIMAIRRRIASDDLTILDETDVADLWTS